MTLAEFRRQTAGMNGDVELTISTMDSLLYDDVEDRWTPTTALFLIEEKLLIYTHKENGSERG